MSELPSFFCKHYLTFLILTKCLSSKRPEQTAADGGTYACTYHGCTHRFEIPALQQKHKREGDRRSHDLRLPPGALEASDTASSHHGAQASFPRRTSRSGHQRIFTISSSSPSCLIRYERWNAVEHARLVSLELCSHDAMSGILWASDATNLNSWSCEDLTLRCLLAEQEFSDNWFDILIEDDEIPSIDDYELSSDFENSLTLQVYRTWWFAMRHLVCHERGPPDEPSSHLPVKSFLDDDEYPPRSKELPDRDAQHSLLISLLNYCTETMSLSRSTLSRFLSQFAARTFTRHGMAIWLTPRAVFK